MTLTMERKAPAVPASGAEILDEGRHFVTRFVATPSPAVADVMAVWDMHTHCIGADRKLLMDSSPRLAILSEGPGSGKTRTMEVNAALCRRPEILADVTGPALALMVADGCTLFVDELDLVLGAGDGARSIRAFLNSGYRRSGAVARAKGKISTFAPVMLGGLANVFTRNPMLRPTASRAIEVMMKPNLGQVPVESWRERLHMPAAREIAEAMAAWAAEATPELTTTYPDLPDGCNDRLADLWEPLMIVAAVAGGDWPDRMVAAFEELGSSVHSSEPALPPGLRLIADIRSVWPDGKDAVTTADLQRLLLEMEAGSWAAMWPDRGAVAREMAALLNPYGIGPRKLRISSSATAQGYRMSDFLEVDVPGVPRVPDVPDSGEQLGS